MAVRFQYTVKHRKGGRLNVVIQFLGAGRVQLIEVLDHTLPKDMVNEIYGGIKELNKVLLSDELNWDHIRLPQPKWFIRSYILPSSLAKQAPINNLYTYIGTELSAVSGVDFVHAELCTKTKRLCIVVTGNGEDSRGLVSNWIAKFRCNNSYGFSSWGNTCDETVDLSHFASTKII